MYIELIFFWAASSFIFTSFLSRTTNKKPVNRYIAQNGHVVCHFYFFAFFSYYEPIRSYHKFSKKIRKKNIFGWKRCPNHPNFGSITPYISKYTHVYATYKISFDAQLAKEAFAPYIVIFRINATSKVADGQHLGRCGRAWANMICNRF